MATRCRNYDANGTPIREGCRAGSRCRYPHPGDPEWDSARNYDHGRGGGGRGGGPRHSDSWGAPPPVPSKVNTVWDSSSWGPSTSSSTQHSTAESDSRGRSSSQSSPRNVTDTRRKETTRWPASDDSGWDPLPSSSRQQSANDAWGSQSRQGSGSGWGGGGSVWGSTDVDDRAAAAAWGAPIPPTSKPSDEQKNIPRDREPTGKFGTSNDQKSFGGKDSTDNRTLSNRTKPVPLPGRKRLGSGVSPSPAAIDDSGWVSLPSSHQQHSTNDSWGSQSGQGSGSGWGSGGSAWGSSGVDGQTTAAAWGASIPETSKTSYEQQNISRDREPARKFSTSNDQKSFGGKDSTNNRTPDALPSGTKSIPLPSRKPPGGGVSPQIPSPVAILDNSRAPPIRKLNIRTDSLGTADSVQSSVPNSASSTHRRDFTVPRNQSFGSTIRLLQSAVRLQFEYNESIELGERWKRTQSSSQYSRAPLLARTKMDKIRATYKQEETRLKKRMDEAIRNLSESPYLSAELNPGVDIKQSKLYTTQLEDWLNELEVYRRLKFPTPSHAPQDSFPEAWKDIKNSLAALDEIAERITEQTTEAKTGAIRVLTDTKTKALFNAYTANNPRTEVDSYEALASEANAVGANLGTQAEHVAELIGSSHGDQAPIEHLQAKLEEELNAQEQIRLSFKQFDEWQQEDAARIKQLKERLKSLHKVPRPVPPANLEQLLPCIRTMVVDDLQKEVVVLIDRLRVACEENSNVFVSEIYNKLQPTLDLTDSLCTRAREAMNAQKDIVNDVC